VTGAGSGFDAAAPAFDRYRKLPDGVPEAIRAAVWAVAGAQSGTRVLDLGAGTGRIGKAFAAAGDRYVGIDLSSGMLREFAGAAACRPALAQADGAQLPFPDAAFDVVLLIQVLTGARGWRHIVAEARRATRAGGLVTIGHTVGPADGIDARLKFRLARILADLGASSHGARKNREEALASLAASAARSTHVVAASWIAERTPRGFLERHRTGARFAALPAALQDAALKELANWAETEFGSLDSGLNERYNFELDLFEMPPEVK
jgi:ubiquinone/menaquinone biosynthesis C-methylase UbiE